VNAIGQLTSCIDGEAGADGAIFEAKGAETGGAILGAPGFILRASLRLGKLKPGGPCVKFALGFSEDLPRLAGRTGWLERIRLKQVMKHNSRRAGVALTT
jgi:hypothetical protein